MFGPGSVSIMKYSSFIFLVWWWPWIVGAFLALIGKLVHEIIENSECVIQLYRDNSGTSSQYEGDSTQNIGEK